LSYDVSFIRRAPGQTWEEANDAAEQSVIASDGAPSLSDEARARLNALADRLIAAWPSLRKDELENGVDLDDSDSGFQACLRDGDSGMSLPYWHDGEKANRIMERMRAVARIIEEETGLQAWDPQAGAGFLESEAEGSQAEYAHGRGFARTLGGKPPWWKFW
jgi:hypothetical protein